MPGKAAADVQYTSTVDYSLGGPLLDQTLVGKSINAKELRTAGGQLFMHQLPVVPVGVPLE